MVRPVKFIKALGPCSQSFPCVFNFKNLMHFYIVIFLSFMFLNFTGIHKILSKQLLEKSIGREF